MKRLPPQATLALRRARAAAGRSDWQAAIDDVLTAQAALSPDRPNERQVLAEAHMLSASWYNQIPDRPRAKAAAEMALLLLPGHPKADRLGAETHGELGTALWYLDDAGKAEPAFRRARELFIAAKAPAARTLRAIGNHALCLQRLGRLDEAVEAFEQVWRRGKAARLAAEARQARRRMGTCLIDAHRLAEADRVLRSAKPRRPTPVGEWFDWHHAMALRAEHAGDLGAAERHYDEATACLERDPAAGAERVGGLVNAAILKLDKGYIESARHLLDRAEAIASSNPPAGFRFTLPAARAALAAADGRLDEAVTLMQSAAATARASIDWDRAYELAFHVFAGELLTRAGRAEDAVDVLLRALATTAGPDLSTLAAAEIPTAFVLAETALVTRSAKVDALRLVRLAGKWILVLGGEEGSWRFLGAMADLASANGDARRAVAYGKLAVLRGRRWLTQAKVHRPEEAAGARRLNMLDDRLVGRLVGTGRHVEARRWRGRRGAQETDALAQPGNGAPGLTDAENRIAEQMERLIGALHADPQRADEAVPLPDYDTLFAWEPSRSRPRTAFGAASAADIAPDQAILRYYTESERPILEFERGGQVKQIGLARASSQVVSLASAFTDAVIEDAGWAKAATELYRLLVEPAADHLEGVRELQIIPGPALAALPFAALSDGRRFLAEHFDLAFRTGAIPPPRAAGPELRVSAFGSSKAAADMPALPFVRAELREIAAVFPGMRPTLDRNFTEAALREALSAGSNIIHIASHFQLAPGSPGRSNLLLGSGKRLPASEFVSSAFDWSKVDLVFLSACETETDDLIFDEERTLAAMLHTAGVLAVVASQWPIYDREGAEFASAFYSALAADPSPARALARSQRTALARALTAATGPAPSAPARRSAGARTVPRNWAGYRLLIPGI